MVSLFPFFFVFSAVAPVILRIALALVFLFEAKSEIKKTPKKEKVLGGLKIVCGIMLLIGFLTQLGALFALSIGLYEFMTTEKKDWRKTIFIVGISLAILLLGPGLWAIDLPF